MLDTEELSSDRKAEDTGKESDNHENIQVERFERSLSVESCRSKFSLKLCN